ncbi:hypothetical protein [Thiobacillus sp.]
MGKISVRTRNGLPQKRVRIMPCLVFAMSLWVSAAGASETSRDPETGLESWQIETQGIQVRLTQISPDQARAFYQARGFTPEQAEDYASRCVFMTVVRNIGSLPIEHRLSDWRYVAGDGEARAIRSKAEWDATWARLGVLESARIAFDWAQFPASQTFHPGDWNQGMTSYPLPRGSRFNLIVNWHTGHAEHKTTLENVRCTDETQ